MNAPPTTGAGPVAARELTLDAEAAELLRRVRAGGGDADVAALRAVVSARSPRLTATVLSVYAVPAGGGVSYGHTFVAESDTRAADVAIGYGHGLPRHAGNRATMTTAAASSAALDAPAVTVPIIGRVAMDDAVVRVDETPVRAGDTLVVFGDQPGETALVDWCALIDEDPVSLLCGLDDRVAWNVRGATAPTTVESDSGGAP